jgi:hypothetical protein
MGTTRSICARATEANDKRDKANERMDVITLMYDVVGTMLSESINIRYRADIVRQVIAVGDDVHSLLVCTSNHDDRKSSDKRKARVPHDVTFSENDFYYYPVRV